MDDIDRQIVALLRQDARRSFQSIGMRVSLSAPAVKRRVDRLEADGVVRGYAARVDPARFGWATHAIVSLFCEGRMAAAEVREAVERHPEVEAGYTVAGEASAMLHVRARRRGRPAHPATGRSNRVDSTTCVCVLMIPGVSRMRSSASSRCEVSRARTWMIALASPATV